MRPRCHQSVWSAVTCHRFVWSSAFTRPPEGGTPNDPSADKSARSKLRRSPSWRQFFQPAKHGLDLPSGFRVIAGSINQEIGVLLLLFLWHLGRDSRLRSFA